MFLEPPGVFVVLGNRNDGQPGTCARQCPQKVAVLEVIGVGATDEQMGLRMFGEARHVHQLRSQRKTFRFPLRSSADSAWGSATRQARRAGNRAAQLSPTQLSPMIAGLTQAPGTRRTWNSTMRSGLGGVANER